MPKPRASLGAENIRYKTVSFAGTGAKDVTEYLMNGHTAEELVQLILTENDESVCVRQF